MTDSTRNFAAHALIALGVVGATQMMFVSPARERADEAQFEISQITSHMNEMTDPNSSAALLEQRDRDSKAAIEALRVKNTHTDPADLVSLVQRIGADSGVRVDRIDPETLQPRTGLRKGDKRAAYLPTSAVALRIEARGTYENVARFVAGIESRPGFTRTDEVTLQPSMTPGVDELGVSIRTAQLSFDPDAFKPAPAAEGATP